MIRITKILIKTITKEAVKTRKTKRVVRKVIRRIRRKRRSRREARFLRERLKSWLTSRRIATNTNERLEHVLIACRKASISGRALLALTAMIQEALSEEVDCLIPMANMMTIGTIPTTSASITEIWWWARQPINSMEITTAATRVWWWMVEWWEGACKIATTIMEAYIDDDATHRF